MKQRTGFVSNSSSSSFLIDLSTINKDEIKRAIHHSDTVLTLKLKDKQIDDIIDFLLNNIHTPVNPSNFKNYRTLDYYKYGKKPDVQLLHYNGVIMRGIRGNKKARRRYETCYHSIKTEENQIGFILLGQDSYDCGKGVWFSSILENIFMGWVNHNGPFKFQLLNWRP